ncbi:MAG: hypothetical protein E6767_10105 [Dysgonomonas sp.]|nr:hypothetical protein [Dysgonomonas sp.]
MNFTKFFIFLFAAALLVLPSCSDDDEEEETLNGTVWVHTDGTYKETLTFSKYTVARAWEDSAVADEDGSEDGTYIYKNSTATAYFEDEDGEVYTMTYTAAGDKMTSEEGVVFTKK